MKQIITLCLVIAIAGTVHAKGGGGGGGHASGGGGHTSSSAHATSSGHATAESGHAATAPAKSTTTESTSSKGWFPWFGGGHASSSTNCQKDKKECK